MAIVARFQFHPDRVEEFSYGGEFVEMQLDELDELIEFCQEFDDALVDVIANVNGVIISAKEVTDLS
ncbi:hypothetical protein SCRES3_gp37 [Synechococcus phage S-CRES3]|jgi:hypothetical protein|nr:hypothetical protein SCRES3_gp37 [Synechococcus phage S-CRES3]